MRSVEVPRDALLRPEWRDLLAIGARPGDIVTEDTDGSICIVQMLDGTAAVLAQRALRAARATREYFARPVQLVRD